ncbi:MAG: RNB domain-containing ribonuclease, partial [Victivallales bacterium]|nr:RNB domain-containing ribonuclease [Victivallales bacterium]
DVLDEAASERPLSLYLPTTTVMMFPDRLSTDLASLNQGVQRPCLAFRIVLNDSGEVLDWNLAPSLVTVSHRLDYDGVDRMLANPGHGELDVALADLLKLADTMREFREEDGAVVLNRPELRVRVRDGEVSVAFEDQESPAHRLVAEFMVLANHLAAKYALLNEIPVIYRVQDPPAGEVCSVHKYEPYFFDQQVRRMKRTRLSTYPQPHFGLGLDLYIQISSPLRRYADLVLHRQLAAHCLGKKPPYTQEELFSVLANVDSTANANRAYEREADHHWLLEYLRRNCLGQEMGATVMRVEGSLVLAELDYYCIRGVVLCRDKPSPGEHVRVTVKEVYPDAQRLVLSLKD